MRIFFTILNFILFYSKLDFLVRIKIVNIRPTLLMSHKRMNEWMSEWFFCTWAIAVSGTTCMSNFVLCIQLAPSLSSYKKRIQWESPPFEMNRIQFYRLTSEQVNFFLNVINCLTKFIVVHLFLHYLMLGNYSVICWCIRTWILL